MIKKRLSHIFILLMALCIVRVQTVNAGILDQVILDDADVNAAKVEGLCRGRDYQEGLKLVVDAGYRSFKESVCKFHAIIADDPSVADPIKRQEQYERFQMAVESVQAAQDTSISIKQQTLMGLMEAQVHCQIANLYASYTADILGKSRFCGARQAAWASINDLDWRYVDFRYLATNAGEYAKHFQRLNECQGNEGIFTESYDQLCGVAPPIDVEKIVDEEIFPVLEKKYFLGTAPISDIFNRKLDLASSIKKSAEEEKASLTRDSLAIGSTEGKISKHFDNDIKSEIDAFVKDYHEAAKISKTILNHYERWLEGLLYDGSKNHADQLTGPDGIQKKLAAMQELFTGGDKSKLKDSLFIVDGIKRIVNRRNSAPLRARSLCMAYYCSIAARNNAFDAFSSYQIVCNDSLYKKNPLCEIKEVSQKIEIVFDGRKQSQTAKEFCSEQSVGLSASETKVNGAFGCPFTRL